MRHQTAHTLAVFVILIGACTSPPATQEPSPVPPLTPTSTSSPPATVEVVPTVPKVIPTSPQEIVGIWDSQVLYERGFHQFREDGTLIIAYTYEQLESKPVFSTPARYWFEGETFHVEDFCGHGTYLLSLTKQDHRNQTLAFQLIDDPCEQRIIDWKRPMRWVEP
ncbi:MAG: hypothetical protein V1755_14965 [Chloroflexota bacterium]